MSAGRNRNARSRRSALAAQRLHDALRERAPLFLVSLLDIGDTPAGPHEWCILPVPPPPPRKRGLQTAKLVPCVVLLAAERAGLRVHRTLGAFEEDVHPPLGHVDGARYELRAVTPRPLRLAARRYERSAGKPRPVGRDDGRPRSSRERMQAEREALDAAQATTRAAEDLR